MTKRYAMRVSYEVLGGHTHMRVRTGVHNCTLGVSGDLCMTNEEFNAWRDKTAIVEFIQVKEFAKDENETTS